MSSFIVNNDLINSIATYLNENKHSYEKDAKEHGVDLDDPQKTAQKLLDMNYEGTNQRYGENKHGLVKYTPIHVNELQLLVNVHCLTYQAGEGNVPEHNDTYKFMESFEGELANHIITNTKAYMECPWDWSREEEKKKIKV